MKAEHEAILGKYLSSLLPSEQRFCGRRCEAIIFYFENGGEVNMKSFKAFQSKFPDYVFGSKHQFIYDLMYFAGVSGGKKRIKKKKTLKERAELNADQEAMIAKFILWLKGKRDYSPKTIRVHSDGIRQFFRYSDTFSQERAKMYINTLEEKGMAPQTLNIRIITLQYWGQYIKKPIELKKYKIQRTMVLENVPTEKEYNKLLSWCKENKPSTYWLVRLLGSTGMRISEIQKIVWRNVVEGVVYLNCKGSKYRYIYFPKGVQEEARQYVKDNNINLEDYVLVNKIEGAQTSARTISFRLQFAAKKCGYPIEKAHCHAFRHFFAKMYLKKAGDVIQLSELLGHESIDTTRIYLQKSKQEHIKDVNRNVTW